MKIGKTAKEHTSQKPEYESAMKTIEEYAACALGVAQHFLHAI